jgi:hypothetical protein
VHSCCDSNGCWYTADKATFPCAGFDCYDAAENVAKYCEPAASGGSSSGDDGSSGCSVASGHSSRTLVSYLTLGALASLIWGRRRKRR